MKAETGSAFALEIAPLTSEEKRIGLRKMTARVSAPGKAGSGRRCGLCGLPAATREKMAVTFLIKWVKPTHRTHTTHMGQITCLAVPGTISGGIYLCGRS